MKKELKRWAVSLMAIITFVFSINAQELQNISELKQIEANKEYPTNPIVCCQNQKSDAIVFVPRRALPDIETAMIELQANSLEVIRLIDPDEIWYNEVKTGNFKTEKERFSAENIAYESVKYVKIEDKIYYQFFISAESLQKKYNPKDLDLSIYRGYILWEAQEDISFIIKSFNSNERIEKVEKVSQYYLRIYASKEFVVEQYGEDFLDPEDGEYPGYFPYARLKTAPYLPLKTDFSTNLQEDKSYRTPYMRVYDLESGEKQAIISMRPNAYPLMPIDYNGSIEDISDDFKKVLIWVDIPTNEPIRQEIIQLINPQTKDAISSGINSQVYMNAIEVDNDGSAPLNWVIEPWEGSYYIQLGSMRDDTGLFRLHNYARLADKFNIAPIYTSSTITGVQYQTYISNTNPTCWDAWLGDCDCITNYQEVGPEVKDMVNNLTSANNNNLGGTKDFNSATWFDDIEGGTIYYIDPAWNWDKGDGYTNYDVVFNAAGITNFTSRLTGGWYVVGIADKNENNESPTYWQGIETLNAMSTLRVSFIPQCANTDLGTITPTSCSWQAANYTAGTIPYWGFTATAGTYYNFTNCSNSEDSYIRIYDSFNNQVVLSDDNGPFCGGIPSSISWTPASSGIYYISLAHYSCANLYNDGTLYYSSSAGQWQQSGSIVPTTTWQTANNTTGQINFWTFTATAGTSYAFNLCDIVEDTYIRIYDAAWTQIAANDDLGPCCSTTSSSIVWTCPADGTYRIAGMHFSCSPFAIAGNLNYKISIPVASATASETLICIGESVTLQGSGTTSCGTISQYDWDHLAGENNPQNPVVSPSSTTTYQLRVLDSNGIWSAWTSVVITVDPLPTATAGGSQNICINGTAVVSGATSANGTIAWTENGAGSITAGANTHTPTYTPAAGDAGNPVTLTMTVTSTNACAPQTAIATYTVNVHPLPTATAGGSQNICVNGTALVSGATSANGTIAWTENGAGSITAGANTLTPTYTPAAGDAGNPVTLTMTVTSTNACAPQTAIATYTVNVHPLPTATAGGSQNICVNGTAVVSGATSANGTIAWTENGAGSITAGANTLTPTYTPAAGDAGNPVTLTMTVTSTNACAPQTAIATYTVNVHPLPTATAGGSQNICVNGTAVVSGATSANGTIAWTENGAGSITAGANTLTPTYTPIAGDAGGTITLTMTVTSNNACAPHFAIATYTVNVHPLPIATAGGSISICPGDDAVVSGASASNGTISWSHNGAGSFTSGQTSLTPTYSSVAADEGNPIVLTMTVTSDNTCNPEIATAIFTVNVTQLPTTPTIVNSDINNFCTTDAGMITLTSTGGIGNLVRWFDDACGGNEIGTSNPLIIPSPENTITYFARNENSCGVSNCATRTITVVQPPVAPTSAMSDRDDFCADDAGNISLSVSGGSGTIVQWFTGSCGGAPIGSGNPLVIPSPEITTEYFAHWENACGQTSCVSVVVKVNSLPTIPTMLNLDRNNFCSDDLGQIELSAVGGLGDDLVWFEASCGSTPIGIGNPLVINSPEITTTYFARYENSCGVTSCQSVLVTVLPLAQAPTFASSSANNLCFDDAGTITISAVGGSGSQIQWYDDACGGNLIGTTNPLIINSPESTTTYFVRWENSCGATNCEQFTVNVILAPENPSLAEIDQNNICADHSGNISLSLSGGSGTEVRWYSASCGGTLVGIGNPLTIESPVVSTTYYGRYESSCGVSTCESVFLNVIPLTTNPASAIVDRTNFCTDDSGDINLSVNGGSGSELTWYTESCGGNMVGSGNPLTLESPEISTTYYARWENSCGESECVSVNVEVVQSAQVPDQVLTSMNNICIDDSGNIELSVTGGNGTTLRWYEGSCEGTEIGTGNPLTIESPAVETQFFARWENICGVSLCNSITITVIDAPADPISAQSDFSEVCINDAGNITLTLVGGAGPQVEWYSSSCGGSSVGTGNPLSIASPVTNTTYFGRYESGCGNSACAEVSVTVMDLPQPPTSAVVDRNNFCSNDMGDIQLSVTDGNGENVYWYTESCGGTFVGTGNPLTIESPEANITYFGRWENSCGISVCQNVTVTVMPSANATINAVDQQCVTGTPFVVTAAQVGGTWSGAGIDPATGFYQPSIAGVGEHSITYTISGTCGDSDQITISVIDLFDATITDVDPMCSNELAFDLVAATAGGTWSGNGITDAANGTFNPNIAGAGNHVITYSYTGLCGSSDNTTIIVVPKANAEINPAGPFCITEGAVAITAIQAGGVWSGNGINSGSGIFNPSEAGVGDHIITYYIAGECGDTQNTTIIVLPLFDATISEVSPMCTADAAITLTAATAGGTWSGTGITDIENGVFNPTIAGPGNHTITYTYTGLCGSTDNITISVALSADASINSAGPFCQFDDPIVITAAQIGGTWSGTGINPATGFFDPEIAGVGNHVITYTITGACGDSDQINLVVYENINANISAQQTYCRLDSIIQLSASPTGGVWSGLGIDENTGVIDTEITETGTFEFIYSIAGSCGDADTVNIQILENADATIQPIDTLFVDGEPVLVVTSQENGVWSGDYIPENNLFNPVIAGVGEFEIIYTIEGECGDMDTVKVIVIPALIANLLVPTAITPDGDGYNDRWRIQGVEAFNNINIRIFTRWGDEVFVFDGPGYEYANPTNQWDGTRKNKALPSGSYVFVLTLDNGETHKGTLSLIR
jgi:gliding motility-associated-like protein